MSSRALSATAWDWLIDRFHTLVSHSSVLALHQLWCFVREHNRWLFHSACTGRGKGGGGGYSEGKEKRTKDLEMYVCRVPTKSAPAYWRQCQMHYFFLLHKAGLATWAKWEKWAKSPGLQALRGAWRPRSTACQLVLVIRFIANFPGDFHHQAAPAELALWCCLVEGPWVKI